jgi:hypothetical protein
MLKCSATSISTVNQVQFKMIKVSSEGLKFANNKQILGV